MCTVCSLLTTTYPIFYALKILPSPNPQCTFKRIFEGLQELLRPLNCRQAKEFLKFFNF